MIGYLLLSLLLFLGMLAYCAGAGSRRLRTASRFRRERLEPCARTLHAAERQALTESTGLAFPAASALWQLEGEVQVNGWAEPMFVLDGLLVAIPEQLLPCLAAHNRAQLLLNPHPGLPHGFVVQLNGASLVCECVARRNGFELPRPQPVDVGQSRRRFEQARPQLPPAFMRPFDQ